MSNYVIDSSVAIKRLFREPGSEKAEKLLQHFTFFYAPDLFLIEMDSEIAKKMRQRKLDSSDAMPKRAQVRKLPYKIIKYKNVGRLAFELSILLSVTIYDATYVSNSHRKFRHVIYG